MSKPEWGVKRICPSCGARYYGFGKALGEIACPKCGTTFDPEAFLKTRRARPGVVPEKEVEPVAAEEVEAETEEVEAEPVEEGEVVEADEEEEVLEDASELGEDEEDIEEVVENIDEEEER